MKSPVTMSCMGLLFECRVEKRSRTNTRISTYTCNGCGRVATSVRADKLSHCCKKTTHPSVEVAEEIPIPKCEFGTDFIAVVCRGWVVDILLLSDRTSVHATLHECGADVSVQGFVDRITRSEKDRRASDIEVQDGNNTYLVRSVNGVPHAFVRVDQTDVYDSCDGLLSPYERKRIIEIALVQGRENTGTFNQLGTGGQSHAISAGESGGLRTLNAGLRHKVEQCRSAAKRIIEFVLGPRTPVLLAKNEIEAEEISSEPKAERGAPSIQAEDGNPGSPQANVPTKGAVEEIEQKDFEFVPEGKQRVWCNQCEMVSINGVPCHEAGCPNQHKVWNPDALPLYETNRPDRQYGEWVVPKPEDQFVKTDDEPHLMSLLNTDNSLPSSEAVSAGRILVVDDEEPIRNIIVSMLASVGYECRAAAGGLEALAVLESGEQFDLLLDDLMMPGLDGIGLLERSKDRYPDMPVVIVTAVHDISVALAALRNGAYDYLMKPFEREQLLNTVSRALENRRLNVENRTYQTNLESLVKARNEQLQAATGSLERAYDQTIETLGDAIRLKDAEIEGHSKRVTAFTIWIARAMGLPRDQINVIARGAFLHDIGKMAIPSPILWKPGALTPDETTIMREHCLRGFEILQKLPFLAEASNVVYTHHERFDGTGYPRGLKGEQIPLGARIVAVANAFDSITSDLPYRRAQSLSRAREEIQRGSGCQFDPKVVAVFLGMPDSMWNELRKAGWTGFSCESHFHSPNSHAEEGSDVANWTVLLSHVISFERLEFNRDGEWPNNTVETLGREELKVKQGDPATLFCIGSKPDEYMLIGKRSVEFWADMNAWDFPLTQENLRATLLRFINDLIDINAGSPACRGEPASYRRGAELITPPVWKRED